MDVLLVRNIPGFSCCTAAATLRRMLSVIIATDNSEKGLLATIVALVPGATSGIVREVIVADRCSRDGTLAIADASGCLVHSLDASESERLRAAAALARGPWLLFLKPGVAPESTWTAEVEQFFASGPELTRVAVFRSGSSATLQPSLRDAFALLRTALGRWPAGEAGLIVSKAHYLRIGGHPDAQNADERLLRRIRRRQIVTLRSGAVCGSP